MYIGDKQVKTIAPMDNQKIPSSLVTFEDGTTSVFTDRVLGYCQSEEPLDPSAYSNLVEFHIIQDLLSVLEIHDVEFFRMDMISRKMAQSIKHKEMEAYAAAFGIVGDEPAEVRGAKVRLSDFRRVLGE